MLTASENVILAVRTSPTFKVLLRAPEAADSATDAIVGATVSSEKLVVPTAPGLPAASVAVAVTAINPFPRRVKSAEVKTTA